MTQPMKIGDHGLRDAKKIKKRLQYRTHKYLKGRAKKVQESLDKQFGKEK